MSEESCPIRVAIVGGGIAGASLFHALLMYPNLDVHIFESAVVFREAGAAVGLTQNAQSALKLIGPSAVQCFEHAGAVSQRGIHLVLAQGPNTGETVGKIGGERDVVGIVHRAAFLRELLADAPNDRLHASKKVQEIGQAVKDGPVFLQFTDGTKHECDILVGADGIHSRVRQFILGSSDPAASPVPVGWWLVQVLKPYAEVETLLQSHIDVDNPGEVGWIGDGALIFHNILSEGNLAQFVVVACCNSGEPTKDWQRVVAAEEIRSIYANWPPTLSKAVEKLICDQTSHTAIYLWEHLPARSYVCGPVGLVGDAAHATTPWQGSGAGMSIEDSLILSTLLGHAKYPAEARVALRVYDSVRRPRTQRVVESSKITGQIVTSQDPETGLDASKLKEKLRHRWNFILDFNVPEHRDQAVRQMEAELKTRCH